MKTTTLLPSLAAVALALGATLALATPAATPSPRSCCAPSPTPTAPSACTDARPVSHVTLTRLSTGGRAASERIDRVTSLRCTACDTKLTVMKPSGLNARGAMTPTTVPGTHECTTGCRR